MTGTESHLLGVITTTFRLVLRLMQRQVASLARNCPGRLCGQGLPMMVVVRKVGALKHRQPSQASSEGGHFF